MRSAWLRLVAFLILVATLLVAKQHDSPYAHVNLVVSYGIVTLLVLAHAHVRRGPSWLSTVFVVVDAMLVVVLFHEHLLASNIGLDHSLTTPALAVGFLLLTQVALRLEPKLVLLFSGLVLLGWLSLLARRTPAGDRLAGILDRRSAGRGLRFRGLCLLAADQRPQRTSAGSNKERKAPEEPGSLLFAKRVVRSSNRLELR